MDDVGTNDRTNEPPFLFLRREREREVAERGRKEGVGGEGGFFQRPTRTNEGGGERYVASQGKRAAGWMGSRFVNISDCCRIPY